MTDDLDHIAIARQLLEQQGEINTLRERAETAEAKIERVRTIHNRAKCSNVHCELGGWCIGCDPDAAEECAAHPWPCPTVFALEPDAKLPDLYAAWVLRRDHDKVVAQLAALESSEVFPLPIRADGTHWYVCTYCVHGNHAACRHVCKSCPSPCECPCGNPGSEPATPTVAAATCMCTEFLDQIDHPDTAALDAVEEAMGDPELTREELQAIVDEQGINLYRAQDVLAFVREMCDAADTDGSPVTTERVRGWLGYTGCGGVLVLPEAAQESLAEKLLRTPATQASAPCCVCGDPIQWMDHPDDPGWIHSPGSDTTCLNARPAVAGPATGSEEPMLAPGAYPKAVGDATMPADMCPRCKGDNSEAWGLCMACEEQP